MTISQRLRQLAASTGLDGFAHELRAIADEMEAQPADVTDERQAFEKWLGIRPCGAAHDLAWSAWKARTALSQQPVTTDPVAWFYTENGEVMFGHPNGYRPPDARPLVFGDTHPAPSVPADVVRDAERYRWLREQNESLESFTFYVGCDNGPDDDGSVEWVGADLDAAIDAAMLAAQDRA